MNLNHLKFSVRSKGLQVIASSGQARPEVRTGSDYSAERYAEPWSKQRFKTRFNRPTEIEKRLVKIVMDNWQNQTEIIWKIYLPHFKSIQYLYSSFLRYQMLLSFKLRPEINSCAIFQIILPGLFGTKKYGVTVKILVKA